LQSLRAVFTRRTALRLIGGGIAGSALAAYGGLTQVLGFVSAVPATAATETAPVVPFGGAGLFDVDPDQGSVSQDPNVVITGDVASLPEGMEV
jgi:hypothetical protein